MCLYVPDLCLGQPIRLQWVCHTLLLAHADVQAVVWMLDAAVHPGLHSLHAPAKVPSIAPCMERLHFVS
jgi:hypothetical protein